jgi:hypothetical protein
VPSPASRTSISLQARLQANPRAIYRPIPLLRLRRQQHRQHADRRQIDALNRKRNHIARQLRAEDIQQRQVVIRAGGCQAGGGVAAEVVDQRGVLALLDL